MSMPAFHRSGLGVCACLWLCAGAFAQELTPELRAGGQLYLHSIGLPKEAEVCERYIPGYHKLFDPLFASWKQRNQDLMMRARDMMDQAARKEGMQLEPAVAELTDNAAAALDKAPEDIIWENCLMRLLALRKPTTRGAGYWALEDYRVQRPDQSRPK